MIPAYPNLRTRLSACLIIGVAVAFIQYHDVVRVLENRLYDARVRWIAHAEQPSSDIVLIGFDDESLQRLGPELGRWPWPRSIHAEIIKICRSAKTIVVDFVFPDDNIDAPEDDYAFVKAARDHGGVISAFYLDDKAAPLPPLARTLTLGNSADSPTLPKHRSAIMPFSALMGASAGIGFVNHSLDKDGVLRSTAALAKIRDKVYPSLSLAGAMHYLDLSVSEVELVRGRDLRVGPSSFPLDRLARFPYRPSSRPHVTYSAAELLNAQWDDNSGQIERLHEEMFKDKIVLIGSLATGLQGNRQSTPISVDTPGPRITATVLDNMLHGTFFRKPHLVSSLLIILVMSLAPAFFRLERPFVMILCGVGVATVYLVFSSVALTTVHFILPMTSPIAAITLSCVVLGSISWRTERARGKTLEQLEQAKQSFTDMLVHDLRNRASPIVVSLSMLENRVPEDDPQAKILLDSARTSASRLVSQVSTLLDIRKIQEGRMQLQKTRFRLSEVIENLLDEYRSAALRADVQIVSVGDDPGTMRMELDEDVLTRILGNLVWNAIKFSTPGTTIEVGCQELVDGQIGLSVANHGSLIPHTNLDELYKPFVSGTARSESSIFAGSGLGLTFCKLASEAHGGSIRIESPWLPYDDGVKVTITLPVSERSRKRKERVDRDRPAVLPQAASTPKQPSQSLAP